MQGGIIILSNLGLRSPTRIFAGAFALVILCGCGTYQLSGAIQSTGKTPQEQQLDILTCKDQARLAANTADRQVGAFLLGLTIVGTPLAFEFEKSKQREEFASCMVARGYIVASPDENKVESAKVPNQTSAINTAVSVPLINEPIVRAAGGAQFQRVSVGQVIYPAQATSERLSAVILIRFTINGDGAPTDLSIRQRQFNKVAPNLETIFDQPALNVVKFSRYKVSNTSDLMSRIIVEQPILFNLPGVPSPPFVNAALDKSKVQEVNSPPAKAEVSTLAIQQSVTPPSSAIMRVPAATELIIHKDEISQLEKLKLLREKKLITADEYEKKRSAVLDGL